MKAFILIISLLLTVIVLFYLLGSSQHIVFVSSQPNSVTYDARYELKLTEVSENIYFFGSGRLSEITISRHGNDFSYGHGISIDILGDDISKTKVEWVESGVNLQFDSGHQLFIPKGSFEGGR